MWLQCHHTIKSSACNTFFIVQYTIAVGFTFWPIFMRMHLLLLERHNCMTSFSATIIVDHFLSLLVAKSFHRGISTPAVLSLSLQDHSDMAFCIHPFKIKRLYCSRGITDSNKKSNCRSTCVPVELLYVAYAPCMLWSSACCMLHHAYVPQWLILSNSEFMNAIVSVVKDAPLN